MEKLFDIEIADNIKGKQKSKKLHVNILLAFITFQQEAWQQLFYTTKQIKYFFLSSQRFIKTVKYYSATK